MLVDPESQLMPLMELKCSVINILFESRPQTKAMKFGLNVGGFFLKDVCLENSIFPYIIAPHFKRKVMYTYFGMRFVSISICTYYIF